jgi:hypothetical protein
MDRITLSRRKALLTAVAASAVWLSTRAVAGADPASRQLHRALALLDDNERLHSELRVIDSQASPAALTQRLDLIAAHNATLVALLAAYAPVARTAAFGPQAARFRDYASAWRARLNAGTALQGEVPVMPEGLSDVLQAELAAL